MSFPVEFSVGSLHLSAHLIFEVLAFFVGYRYFVFLRKGREDHISEENRIKIIAGAALGAFFFSRLLGSLENPAGWFHEDNFWLYFFKNKTIVGGLLGGLLGVELIKKVIGERQSSGDLFVFPLMLAMMIGRVGCFSSGVYEATFRIETAMPFGLDLGDGLTRHPVALYEIAFLGAFWIFLHWLSQKNELPSGWLFQFLCSAICFSG
jgi:prolipoprotein diacylglyceryltransferase